MTKLINCPQMCTIFSKEKRIYVRLDNSKTAGKAADGRLASAGVGRNAETKQENRFSKSSLFFSLITLHLCFSPDIKTNPSWLTGGGGGLAIFTALL